MIFIKDLDIPTSCANCTFNRYNICLVKIKDPSIFGKPDWCPLVDAEKVLTEECDCGCEYAKQEPKFQKGLQAAWEAAKEFFGDYVICLDNWEQLTRNEVVEKYRLVDKPFPSVNLIDVFFQRGPEYAIESLRLWKEKNEIQVGDEVKTYAGALGVVTYIDEKSVYGMKGKDAGFVWLKKDLKKTGRHFPEVAELLEKMKEGANNED